MHLMDRNTVINYNIFPKRKKYALLYHFQKYVVIKIVACIHTYTRLAVKTGLQDNADEVLFLCAQVSVPRFAVGIVIGRNGEMIKKIQNDAGVRIQFKPGWF